LFDAVRLTSNGLSQNFQRQVSMHEMQRRDDDCIAPQVKPQQRKEGGGENRESRRKDAPIRSIVLTLCHPR
jgi:hypothetical protein